MGMSGQVSVRALGRLLDGVPDDVRRELRPALRRAGELIRAESQARSSWSTRIPAAHSVRTRFTGKRPGVIVAVDAARAPHARPYEGLTTRGDTFRHPVFGDDDIAWVSQPTRPYLFPAAEATRNEATNLIADAVRRALDTIGKG